MFAGDGGSMFAGDGDGGLGSGDGDGGLGSAESISKLSVRTLKNSL